MFRGSALIRASTKSVCKCDIRSINTLIFSLYLILYLFTYSMVQNPS